MGIIRLYKVPYWDFRLPIYVQDIPRDSSAAPIAASALLELAAALPGKEGAECKRQAEQILYSLYKDYGALKRSIAIACYRLLFCRYLYRCFAHLR